MVKTSTPVDAQLFAFLTSKAKPEDAFLGRLRADAAAAGLPEIHISPEQATFLRLMMQTCNARRVVEVGTLGGYSGISMARGMPADGRVITHEIEPKHAEFARAQVARSDVAGKVEVVVGPAAETLAKQPDGEADAVFLDADKTGYVTYLEHAMRMLRPGGLLLADNVLAGGRIADGTEEKDVALRAFLDAAKARDDLDGIVLAIGDGIWFGVKQG